MYPATHPHVYMLVLSVHVPSFIQGVEAHSSMSANRSIISFINLEEVSDFILGCDIEEADYGNYPNLVRFGNWDIVSEK